MNRATGLRPAAPFRVIFNLCFKAVLRGAAFVVEDKVEGKVEGKVKLEPRAKNQEPRCKIQDFRLEREERRLVVRLQ